MLNCVFLGLGVSMVITNLMVAMYYNVIIAWCLYYLFASMTDKLPWESCDNLWNTAYCIVTKDYANLTFENSKPTCVLTSILLLKIGECQMHESGRETKGCYLLPVRTGTQIHYIIVPLIQKTIAIGKHGGMAQVTQSSASAIRQVHSQVTDVWRLSNLVSLLLYYYYSLYYYQRL
jgi:hypothetical protein